MKIVTALHYLSAGFFLLHGTRAFDNCPILGPVFPPPSNLAASIAIQNATTALKVAIEDGLTTGTLNSNLTSFSLEIFSAQTSKPLFEFYHTAPVLASSTGTKTVGSDSIYRIGSISKLFSVYTFLVEAGDIHFNEPITKYVPELAAASRKAITNAVDFVDWNEVTIGNLASHMGGIGRDYAITDLATQIPTDQLVLLGLPPLNASDIPPCSWLDACTRKEFFAGFTKRHPVFGPSTTPTYSNVAFQILSYALETITGRPFSVSMKSGIFDKLDLKGTTYSKPMNDSHGVIPPGDSATVAWDINLGDFTPGGGLYSSSSDLATVGRSILNSKLLRPAQIRRWMKPVTFTSGVNAAVGAPWEITRMHLQQPPRLVDIYAKGGTIGVYQSQLDLVPDWKVGFAVLQAGPGLDYLVLTELIAQIFFPAVEVAAREQADVAYAGTYRSADPNLNSSLTITTDPGKPGLGLTSFISNGTDLLTILAAGAGIPASDFSVRLYPTGLTATTSTGETRIAWRGVMEYTGGPAAQGVFSSKCDNTWGSLDQQLYGSVSIDEIVFTLGVHGRAKSVEPRVVRASLERV